MRAYNIQWVRNLQIQQIAQSWFDKNLISADQFAAVKSEFPEKFYRPGIFVKIGLFIFGLVGCLFFTGFLSLFLAGSGGDGAISAMSIISAICFVVALEFLIRERKLYHSGIDNALLYAAIVGALVPFFVLVQSPPVWLSCIVALLVLIPAILRYADLVTMVAAFAALLILFSNIMMQFKLGAALLPFGIMLVSGGLFFLNRKREFDYYTDCQMLLEALCLIAFYAGGNYYVVREGNALLNDLGTASAPQIPFALLFYIFTFSIPILYIISGLRTMNRMMLIIGLVATAFSGFTYKYYFGFLSLEVASLLVGIALILFAVWAIKFFKTPKWRITDEKHGKRKLANLEAFLVAQQLGQAPAEKGFEFGGGDFGGGGAQSGY